MSPRPATHKVERDHQPPFGEWLCACIAAITAHKNMFRVVLILTNHDYRRIEVVLSGPITPESRIGQLLAAAGIKLVPDQRISIDAAMGRHIRVQLMVIASHFEPVAFAPIPDHREHKEP